MMIAVTAALRSAESFIEAELNVRRASFLPTESQDELMDIEEAETTLAEIRAALREVNS
jgi:hypothetical protein